MGYLNQTVYHLEGCLPALWKSVHRKWTVYVFYQLWQLALSVAYRLKLWRKAEEHLQCLYPVNENITSLQFRTGDSSIDYPVHDIVTLFVYKLVAANAFLQIFLKALSKDCQKLLKLGIIFLNILLFTSMILKMVSAAWECSTYRDRFSKMDHFCIFYPLVTICINLSNLDSFSLIHKALIYVYVWIYTALRVCDSHSRTCHLSLSWSPTSIFSRPSPGCSSSSTSFSSFKSFIVNL